MGEKYVIDIDKSEIPYEFDITLNNQEITLGVNYNAAADLFTLDLLIEGDIINYGLPIMYGVNVFDVVRDLRMKGISVIAYEPGQPGGRVGWDNLNETIFLYHESGEDVDG